MMLNNINNKRARDEKNIVITLGKTEEGYYYFGDSLTERSKIKIPLDDLTSKENLISYSPADSEIKKEKSEKGNVKIVNGSMNGHHILPVQEEIKQNPVEMNNVNNIINSKEQEEIPLLAKVAEKNARAPIIIPSCSQWFKFDDIHEVEMKALPEFFCGKYPSKTPDIYKEYRNYIINLYRENTNSYLSATSKINSLFFSV